MVKRLAKIIQKIINNFTEEEYDIDTHQRETETVFMDPDFELKESK